mmetsp:Transcript_27251/g.63527  ORF Transcript_27251/g.63527 Transcript_27251/m.63527 type:complete len:218 (-) Transcript_27251:1385-2038(-)
MRLGLPAREAAEAECLPAPQPLSTAALVKAVPLADCHQVRLPPSTAVPARAVPVPECLQAHGPPLSAGAPVRAAPLAECLQVPAPPPPRGTGTPQQRTFLIARWLRRSQRGIGRTAPPTFASTVGKAPDSCRLLPLQQGGRLTSPAWSFATTQALLVAVLVVVCLLRRLSRRSPWLLLPLQTQQLSQMSLNLSPLLGGSRRPSACHRAAAAGAGFTW